MKLPISTWNTTRRLLAGAFAATSLALALVPAQAQNISFRFNDSDATEMRAALDVFEKSNPGIKVTMQRTSWKDARDQFLRENAVSQGPDVVHIAFVWTRELARAGALLPLDDLLAKSNVQLKDFVADDLVMQDNKAYGLPWTSDTWAMVYRTDLLERAGVAKLPATWQELRAASQAVHARTGKTGFGFPGGSAASGGIWFLANFYWWSNGDALIVKKPDGSFGLGLDRKAVADAMAYYKSFITEGHAPKAVVSYNDAHDPAIMQALAQGDQAIGIMPTNTYKQLLKTWADANPGKPTPFASGLVPRGSKTQLTHLGGRTLAINANTKHVEAAWKLVQYLNTAPVFAPPYYSSQFPARKSLLRNVKFSHAEAGFAAQLADHTRTWGPYSEGPAPLGQLWNLTNRAFGAALSDQKTPEAAADELLREVERLLGAKS
jgi:multiple sugar transport system substrate-binding protein